MKGSAVVQGLKSLASKLHPQLPLSPKESQRLLTALTSSFREQLDQAHPSWKGSEEGKTKPGNVGPSKVEAPQLHSSSEAFADRHLASVLTNPLLTKRTQVGRNGLDYATAKTELQVDPTKDPISLLGKYDKQNAATIPIARLCLERFKQTIESLPNDERQLEILKTKAGTRTLSLMWNSKLHETDAFSDDVDFMNVLVSFVVREGSEKYLWDWYQIDMVLSPPNTTHDPVVGERGRSYPYRWKGRMLRAIVQAKLMGSSNMSADEALDAFFVACDLKEIKLKQARNPGLIRHQDPLIPAFILLVQTFHHSPERRGNTDPGRFDRFVERNEIVFGARDELGYKEFNVAELLLRHPRASSRSALPALEFLRNSFTETTNSTSARTPSEPAPKRKKSLHFIEPKDKQTMVYHYFFMKDTADLLRQDGQEEDAEWVLSLAAKLFPELAAPLKSESKKASTSHAAESTKATTTEEVSRIHEQVPFPTFG